MATPLTRKHGRRLFRDTFLAAVCVSLVACGQHSTRPDAAEDWPQFDDEAAQAFIERCQSELDAARAQFLALETPSAPVSDAQLLQQIKAKAEGPPESLKEFILETVGIPINKTPN